MRKHAKTRGLGACSPRRICSLDLRSTFELDPKDTNTLGKAIFLTRVSLDNHLIALWSMCVLM